MLNRGAITLRYREPAIQWINEADPPDEADGMTDESVNQSRQVYLVPRDTMSGFPMARAWLEANFEFLLETELESWFTDPVLWPANRDFSLFLDWFEVEFHDGVVDTVDEVLLDDDI